MEESGTRQGVTSGSEDVQELSAGEDASTALCMVAVFVIIAVAFTAGVLVMMAMMADGDDEPTGNATTLGKRPIASQPTPKPPSPARTKATSSKGGTDVDYTSEDYASTVLTEHVTTKGTGKKTDQCRTEDCLNVVRYYRESFGLRGTPCTNAYLYVCSGRKESVVAEMRKTIGVKIGSKFAEGSVPARGQTARQKALAFYRYCINRDNPQQVQDNLSVIKTFMGEAGLSFQEDNSTDPLDLTLKLLLRYDTAVFFYFKVNPIYIIVADFALDIVESPEFELRRQEHASRFGTIDAYNKYVKTALATLGLQSDDSTVLPLAARLSSAEGKILNIREENDDKSPGPSSILMRDVIEVQSLKSRWASLLGTYSNNVLPASYQTISAIAIRKFINAAFSRLMPSELNLYATFAMVYKLFTVGTLVPGLNYSCLEGVQNLMKHAVMTPYLMSIVNTSKIDGAIAIATHIREKALENMQQSSWLDEQTKKPLVEKLRTMSFQIGFPKGLRTPQEVEDYYGHFPDMNGPVVMAYLNISVGRAATFLKTLAKKPADLMTLDFNYVDVIASYSGLVHAILIPAGTLLCPEYNYGAPPEVNYGHLGKTIVHEMMHAFDESNRRYDWNAAPLTWGSASDRAFREREACFNESIRNTPIAKRTVYDEYLADVLGSRSLYQAYKEEEEKSTTTIPGLESYTPDQIFFLARCFLFCYSTPYVDVPGHPNNPHRCNLPLANTPEYGTAFGCPVGSPMNPARKCGVW